MGKRKNKFPKGHIGLFRKGGVLCWTGEKATKARVRFYQEEGYDVHIRHKGQVVAVCKGKKRKNSNASETASPGTTTQSQIEPAGFYDDFFGPKRKTS